MTGDAGAAKAKGRGVGSRACPHTGSLGNGGILPGWT